MSEVGDREDGGGGTSGWGGGRGEGEDGQR